MNGLDEGTPGPDAIAAEPDGAKELLRKASRGHFEKERLEAIITSAEKATGVPMANGEQEKLRVLVEQLEAQLQRLAAVDSELNDFVEKDEVLKQMTTVVGPAARRRSERQRILEMPEPSRRRWD